jgi:hypothetical protein
MSTAPQELLPGPRRPNRFGVLFARSTRGDRVAGVPREDVGPVDAGVVNVLYGLAST